MSEEKNLKGSLEKEKRHFRFVSMTKNLVNAFQQHRKRTCQRQIREIQQRKDSSNYSVSSSHVQGGCRGDIVSSAHETP